MEQNSKKRMFLFFVVMCVLNMAANFAHPVTPTFIVEYHLKAYMFGVALAAMQIANFLFSPFWGKLNGYISSRTSMLIGCTGYAIGQAMFGLARTEMMVVIARGFSGIFIGATFVSFLTYIVNCSPEQERGRNLMIQATIGSVCSAFGFMIGGFLGEISIGTAFAAQSILLFLCGIAFYFVCEKDTQMDIHQITTRQLVKEANPFAAFADSRKFMTVMFAILFSVTALQNLGYTAYDQCFNYFIKDQLGFTSAYNGVIKGVIGFISLAANSTICLWIIKRTNVKKSTAYVLGACTFTTLAVVFVDAVTPFLIINIVYYAFNAVAIPLLQALVAEKAQGKESNVIMGFYNATKSLGGIIGSLVAGLIYAKGAKYSFIFAAVVFVIATCCSALYYKKEKREKTVTSK
ncbi:MFS transporter [Acidaminobacterium chupaoyuni]